MAMQSAPFTVLAITLALAACSKSGNIADSAVLVSKGARYCKVQSTELPCAEVVSYLRDTLHTPTTEHILVLSGESDPGSTEDVRGVMETLQKAGYSRADRIVIDIVGIADDQPASVPPNPSLERP